MRDVCRARGLILPAPCLHPTSGLSNSDLDLSLDRNPVRLSRVLSPSPRPPKGEADWKVEEPLRSKGSPGSNGKALLLRQVAQVLVKLSKESEPLPGSMRTRTHSTTLDSTTDLNGIPIHELSRHMLSTSAIHVP